jgi:hypothetical protein
MNSHIWAKTAREDRSMKIAGSRAAEEDLKKRKP